MNDFQELINAQNLIQQQQWGQAAQVCEAIIREHPDHIDAAYLLSITYLNLGKNAPAKAILEKITEVQPGNSAAKTLLASAYAQNGEFSRAAALGLAQLQLQPGNAALKQQVAYFLFQAGETEQVVQLNKELLASDPNNAEFLGNISAALIRAGRLDEAEPFVIRAMKAAPAVGVFDYQLSLIQLARHDFARAEISLRSALGKAPPNAPEIQAQLGMSLYQQGKKIAARDVYAQLLQQAPNFTVVFAPYGQLLYELADFDQALRVLPQAIAAHPGNIQIRISLARILVDRYRYIEARQVLNALDNISQNTEALSLKGVIELALKNYSEAINLFEQTLAQEPEHTEARLGLLSATRHICAFERFDREIARFLPDFRANPAIPVAPFLFISFPGATAADHLEAANRQAQTLQNALSAQSPLQETIPVKSSGKIRVGFLTNDFRQHATSFLMIEMLEQLDHTQFEWHGFSWGKADDADVMRPRIEAALDQFHDISTLTDHAAAQFIKDKSIDILIDLKGYTQGCRPLITARQPAKIQINWLGFPGSMGQGIADFMIADSITCPQGSEANYAEKILRLPNWYLPSPLKPKVSRRKARSSYGLPAEGVVFGCFNQSYKITSDVFTLWCDILKAVPHSVLWLLENNADATENLKAKAIEQGINAERLIFAGYIPHADNLARLAHMDIMLDTFYYNGHTTASDALSQGVPVITKMGATFPSRVAASLLTAAGLSDLVCVNEEEYVQKAIEMAQDATKLADLRAHIKKNRSKMALFNSKQFARGFESIVKQAFEAHSH